MQDTPRKRKPDSDDLTSLGSGEPAGDDVVEQDTEKTSAPATHDPKRAVAGDERSKGKKDRAAEPRPEEEKEKTGAPSMSFAQRMRFQKGRRPRR